MHNAELQTDLLLPVRELGYPLLPATRWAISKQKAADVGHFGRDEAAAGMRLFAEMAVTGANLGKTGVIK